MARPAYELTNSDPSQYSHKTLVFSYSNQPMASKKNDIKRLIQVAMNFGLQS